jgi:tripartite-type tricarboxylate transporter receptor subunit TctC
MAVNMDVPAKSVEEFIAYAKQNDGKLTFSSSGVGNPQQLTGELFNKMAGVQIRHVPYKGAAPQLAALAGKEVTMTYVSIGAALPFIQSNRIRPIGVTSSTRVAALPDVPPIADTLSGFELVNFFGFFGPAGLPAPILARLNSAATQVMKTPELVTKFRGMGFEPTPTAPEEFRQFIRAESAKFAAIIKEAGIKLD